MANTDLVAPLVVAAIGLVGTVVSLLWGWHIQKLSDSRQDKIDERNKQHDLEMGRMTQKHQDDMEVIARTHQIAMAEYTSDLEAKLKFVEIQLEEKRKFQNLTEKYSQPLLAAAYDLQQRLFELVEYPISRQHLSTKEGLEDIKIFSCYLLAQYLVYAYILRTKTGYLSFAENENLKEIRNMMYLIDQELDQRRDDEGDGNNIGVWPASRIVVCERMIVPGSKSEVNEMLDAGFGLEVKGYTVFRSEWSGSFKEPMGFFCEWIDDMLEGRLYRKPHWDAALRELQHFLIDLIIILDEKKSYVLTTPGRRLKCKESSRGCVCRSCEGRAATDLDEVLKNRQDARYCEKGLWSVGGLPEALAWRTDYEDYRTSSKKIDLEAVTETTQTREAR